MGRDRQLYELSKSNPVLNIRWKDRINQITNHFTKDSFPCLLYKPINNFYINVKKYYFTSFILNQGQPGLAIMAKKKKKTKLQFYFLPVYDPLVSVLFKISWLWLTCNWLFDYEFTYWVLWCVHDTFSIPEIKCYFSVLTFIVFRVEHLWWGIVRASWVLKKVIGN